jgi:hypothetical protein
MTTMDMVIVVATTGEATTGMVMDPGGLTVEAMGMVGGVMVGAVVVGIRAPEFMSAPAMATTQILTNALPQGWLVSMPLLWRRRILGRTADTKPPSGSAALVTTMKTLVRRRGRA